MAGSADSVTPMEGKVGGDENVPPEMELPCEEDKEVAMYSEMMAARDLTGLLTPQGNRRMFWTAKKREKSFESVVIIEPKIENKADKASKADNAENSAGKENGAEDKENDAEEEKENQI